MIQDQELDDHALISLTDADIIERLTKKIFANGLTLGAVFDLLDADADQILTIDEIRKNIAELNLNLTPQDLMNLIKILDKNSDGSVDKQEFVSSLENPLKY